MNPELVRKALEKVTNPNVLVNMLSRRVRQLSSYSGAVSRPLVGEVANIGLADIALREIIEDKMGFELPEVIKLTRPNGVNRKRPSHWSKT
jgi:DNA-directed RNA polymerase subunit omega